MAITIIRIKMDGLLNLFDFKTSLAYNLHIIVVDNQIQKHYGSTH